VANGGPDIDCDAIAILCGENGKTMESMSFEHLKYSIGVLMYVPALNKKIAAELCERKYPHLSSIVFCFEDSILDRGLEEAEETFSASLDYISSNLNKNTAVSLSLPKIFARVRSVEQFHRIRRLVEPHAELVTGFVIPKYTPKCAKLYEREIHAMNSGRKKPLYVMPTLESAEFIYKENRLESLLEIKKRIDEISPYVLNVRVGGNDFCALFGLRRHVSQTIYDIAVVRDALSDILNVFSRDYVVSGPVWEYFANDSGEEQLWKKGLQRELELDRLNGFIGKTAIHPSQLPVIANAMKVKSSDYEDALQILNWNDSTLGVVKSASREHRLNEVKVHATWARKILSLAEIYGVSYD